MTAKLSVNVNKIATLRNSRGGNVPDLSEATRVIMAAGAMGITVHPRADERHIRYSDVATLAAVVASSASPVEYNIEGDPRPELMDLVCEVRPTQCTLVPVRPGEVTSEAGWDPSSRGLLAPLVQRLQRRGIRVSIFVDAEPAAVRFAAELGAERIELYTEPFARAFAQSFDAGRQSFERFAAMSELAAELGLGVNAGHDLDLHNLVLFRHLPHLAEVSIGHALISDALYVGLEATVRSYVQALDERRPEAR
jgi:pyridoxine 5-phosphate synthase